MDPSDAFDEKGADMSKACYIGRAAAGLLAGGGLLAFAGPALAQMAPAHVQPANTMLHWVWIAGVFIVLWVFFYKLIYPFLLRHYRADVSKALFWLLFCLYSVSWLQVVFYVFFDYGFRYFWIGWTALLLSVVFLISFLVTLLRHPA
jgi:hypothetical protein